MIFVRSKAHINHSRRFFNFQSPFSRITGMLKVSEKTLHRSLLITKMGTSKYQELARKRAGIEGIPSVLRRRYKIDHLPVRGEVRVKVWLGFKISAINCKRLIKGLMNRPKEGLPTLLYNHLLSLFSFQRTYRVKFAA